MRLALLGLFSFYRTPALRAQEYPGYVCRVRACWWGGSAAIDLIEAPHLKPLRSEGDMAKNGDGVYKIVEVVGSSSKSWEDAANVAVATAAKTLRDLRIAEVSKLDLKVEDGKVVAYRARVSLSFKYEI
jgi:flavin-binding protein dodecin